MGNSTLESLGHTKLMFRIMDFSGHFLEGRGGLKIKIKLIEQRCAKYAKSVKKTSILKTQMSIRYLLLQ